MMSRALRRCLSSPVVAFRRIGGAWMRQTVMQR
jgi:hypothetical protein